MQTVAELKREEYEHVRKSGGWWELGEADDVLNDGNRKQIAAYKREKGAAWLGNINFYYEQGEQVVNGSMSVYEEYTGQMVYNFGCTFCVPFPDETLSEMIREWNTEKTALSRNAMGILDSIMRRIDEIGGINFIWT